MTRRSRAREVALQLLVQFECNPGVARPVVERFVHERLKDAALERFCLELFDGAAAQREEIDRLLAETAANWRLVRMAMVDRNVLRLGAFELLFTPGTPPSAAINEAIELARRYGTKNSPSFVNGMLDQIQKTRNAALEVRNSAIAAANEAPGSTP